MKLTIEKVKKILNDSFFKEGEIKENAVIVEGIIRKFVFHPERLNNHNNEIKELLLCLPQQFQKASGGWSFLNGCLDKEGMQWGEHENIEELLALGLATKQAYYCFPRDMWNILPGGVPYFGVNVE